VTLYFSKQRHSGLWRSKSSGNLLPDSELLLLKRSALMCDEPHTPTALTAADLPITTSSSKGTYPTCVVFNCDSNNFCGADIRMEMKLCLLNVYVLPVLLYGAETWSPTSPLQKKLGACQQWCLRRLLCILHLQLTPKC